MAATTIKQATQTGLHEQTRTVLALLFSVSPLYFLVQSHAAWGLDKLHLGLIQFILLLLFKGVLKLDPRRLFATKPPAVEVFAPPAPPSDTSSTTLVNEPLAKGATTSATSPPLARPRQRHRRPRPPPPPPSNPLYPPHLLDQTVAHFLSLVSPQLLSHLPPSTHPTSATPLIPLASWTQLYAASGLAVTQHPSLSALYSVEAAFPGVPIKALWETLLSMERRTEWDGMCAGAEVVGQFEVEGRQGNVIWMGMKGMAFIKPKDMVLLSVMGRLPPIPPMEDAGGIGGVSGSESRSPTPTSEGSCVDSTAPTPRLRLFSATTSFDHPNKPPAKEYARMKTSSGFVIEDDGQGGSRILQLTDLSGLGSWVPNAVLKAVTQTMIPKSLEKLSQAASTWAAQTASDPSLSPDATLDWLPPLLGATVTPAPASAHPATSASSAYADSDASDSESDVDAPGEAPLTPSAARDLHALVAQLKSLTARLGALEARDVGAAPGTGRYDALLRLAKREGVAVGGATVAAVAAVVLWRRGRRGRR